MNANKKKQETEIEKFALLLAPDIKKMKNESSDYVYHLKFD